MSNVRARNCRCPNANIASILAEKDKLYVCGCATFRDVETGYPSRDRDGIIRKRDGSGKVADTEDWIKPHVLNRTNSGREHCGLFVYMAD